MSLLAVTAKLIKPSLHQMPMTSKILRLGALRFEGTEPQFTVLPEPINYPMGCEVEPDCYGGSRARPICKKLNLKTFTRAKQPSKSIWDTVPEIGPCRTDQSYSLENPPRFDELYYRMSDKAKRKYQMTWAQTTSPRNKRYCCDLNKIIPPPFIKRPRKEKAKKELRSACECNETKFEFICKKPQVKQGKCPQIMLEKCLTGRRPPSCDRGNKINDCTKKCCPYPSYSECCQEKPARIPSRPPECFCLVPPPMCIVYREMRRLKTMAKRDDPAPVVCG